MSRRPITVLQLARDADVDLDEALVTLWDHGVDVLNPEDRVPYRLVKPVLQDLGVALRRELRSLKYWEMLLGISRVDLLALLESLGTPAGRDESGVPKKGISKLKIVARQRGINPLTGTIEETAQRSDRTITAISSSAARQRVVDDGFEWTCVGHRCPLRFLTEEQALEIHWALVEDFSEAADHDPISPPGVRNRNLLGSAVFRPQTSLGDQLKYPTAEMSAAALLHAFIHDHPFHNGNKRTALVLMLVALDENGIFPEFDEGELFKLVLIVAQHRLVDHRFHDLADREVLAIAEWICSRTRLVKKDEKPLPWRILRKILRDYDCEMDTSIGVGNRTNIERTTQEQGMFGRRKTVILNTQVFYAGDGREVEVDTIKKIRKDLRLDDTHGVDSYNFYDKKPMQASHFIAKYRKTLYRLARL